MVAVNKDEMVACIRRVCGSMVQRRVAFIEKKVYCNVFSTQANLQLSKVVFRCAQGNAGSL
jgi:meiotically up-regulated gene 157 (Mug157) protein